MPISRKRDFDCVSSIKPPQEILEDVDTIKFVIYNFKYRQEKRDEYVKSPILKAHGYEWRILVYPRGNSHSSKDTEYISANLELCGSKNATATFAIECKGFKNEMSGPYCLDEKLMVGEVDILERDDAIKKPLEDDGSFVIACNVQIAAENKRVWHPKQLQ